MTIKNNFMILDNENITTLEWNMKHEKLMLQDGWKDLNNDLPKEDERVLVVGDFKSDYNQGQIKNRRMSLCIFNIKNDKIEFSICDAEYYIPYIINVRWWKPLTF